MSDEKKKAARIRLKFGKPRVDPRPRKRLRKFAERVRRSFPILVCRRCGSTSVASNLVAVSCLDCFTSAPIDGKRFMTVLCRPGGVPKGLERSEVVGVLGERMNEELEKVLDEALSESRGNASSNEKERR